MDGPGPIKVYLDPYLRRLADEGELDWSNMYEKFWLQHPALG
ncbi:MAG TPA: hypothetical protein VD973_18190 [Symbiobacteriaceae bacterium]|nr:hypothetical protein [Symbiobacteriaceae bacterium]